MLPTNRRLAEGEAWVRGEAAIAREAWPEPVQVNRMQPVQWVHNDGRVYQVGEAVPQPMHRLDDEVVEEAPPPVDFDEENQMFEEREREAARLARVAEDRQRYLDILNQLNRREEDARIERMLRDGD